ncbi:Fic/DOC family protein [Leifsonia sp. NPDC058194]|uniref:Fic/DOC family protein n=1 Tax=Leifsonia sp. NPDC058194 TaxID=3346374 RepID=UPI0036D88678
MIERPVDKPPKRKLPAPLYGIGKKIRTRGMNAEQIAWEDYLIPGMASDVLRNKVGLKSEPYGCTDQDVLTQREEVFSAFRMVELKQNPIPGDFGLEHMKAIHKHLFQDVYEWAGETRNVDLWKNGYDYAPHQGIEMLWNEQHKALQEDGMLTGIEDPADFADALAYHWGMVNVAHAFREGNTRAQTIFFHQLAHEAAWELDVAKLSPTHPESIRDEFVEARFHHQGNGFDHAPLAAVLAKAITRREPELERAIEASKAHEPHQSRLHSMQRAMELGAQKLVVEEDRTVDPPRDPRRPASRPGSMRADLYRRFPELTPEQADSVRSPRHRAEPDLGAGL